MSKTNRRQKSEEIYRKNYHKKEKKRNYRRHVDKSYAKRNIPIEAVKEFPMYEEDFEEEYGLG